MLSSFELALPILHQYAMCERVSTLSTFIDGSRQSLLRRCPSTLIWSPKGSSAPWPTPVARCWKAIIYDRFRQKFSACQSHPAGASQAQFLPWDKMNFLPPIFNLRNRLNFIHYCPGSPWRACLKTSCKVKEVKCDDCYIFVFSCLSLSEERIMSHWDNKQVWFVAVGQLLVLWFVRNSPILLFSSAK